MNPDLVLASGSPRRRRLLEQAGLALSIRPAEIDETRAPGEPAVEYSRRVAAGKAASASTPDEPLLVLGADTVVHDEDQILGKPENLAHAVEMLTALSGRWHQVTTGFVLHRRGEQLEVGHVTTRVAFRSLTCSDIERYVQTGEAMDKAGSYGIQGQGGSLVDRVEGSYTNVVGLPLPEVLEAIDRHRRGGR